MDNRISREEDSSSNNDSERARVSPRLWSPLTSSQHPSTFASLPRILSPFAFSLLLALFSFLELSRIMHRDVPKRQHVQSFDDSRTRIRVLELELGACAAQANHPQK